MAKSLNGMKNILTLPAEGHEAHVWQVDLDSGESDIRHSEALLCCAEKKRAERFVFLEHRRRFITAHAELRIILGGYLGLDPENVSIMPDENGKPALTPATNCPSLYFNLSHSAGIAIIGISAGRAIGVDVEHVRPVFHMDGICRRFFVKSEARLVELAPDEVRSEMFFQLWTMKEACLKACGEGLRGLKGLPSIVCETGAGIPAALIPNAACLTVADRSWSVKRIFAVSSDEAAVALEGAEPWDVIYRRL